MERNQSKRCSLVFINFLFTFQGEVTINYNKLHADPKQGKTLDISKSPKFLISEVVGVKKISIVRKLTLVKGGLNICCLIFSSEEVETWRCGEHEFGNCRRFGFEQSHTLQRYVPVSPHCNFAATACSVLL